MNDPNEYVVLRMPGAKRVLSGSRTSTRSGDAIEIGSGEQSAGEIRVDAEQLDESKARELGEAEDTLGLGSVMPMQLCKPVEVSQSEPELQDAATWGLHAVGAAASSWSGKGVKVAILDTGIHESHPAFRRIRDRIVEEDFTGEGKGDKHGHGTHCAGTICGGEIENVRIGVAQDIEKLIVAKVLDENGRGTTKAIYEGLLWAAGQGANVISMSLAIDFPGQVAQMVEHLKMPLELAMSKTLEQYRENLELFAGLAQLIEAASGIFSRCIVVAATGNESKRPDYGLSAAPPAVARGVLAVGAAQHESDGKFAVPEFSNSGADVAAPGVHVRSAALGGGSETLSGTSMATPHVAGVAALWMQYLLEHDQSFRISDLRGALTGRAERDVFIEGVDSGLRGSGLVQAPSG